MVHSTFLLPRLTVCCPVQNQYHWLLLRKIQLEANNISNPRCTVWLFLLPSCVLRPNNSTRLNSFQTTGAEDEDDDSDQEASMSDSSSTASSKQTADLVDDSSDDEGTSANRNKKQRKSGSTKDNGFRAKRRRRNQVRLTHRDHYSA